MTHVSQSEQGHGAFSRRLFLKGASTAAATGALAGGMAAEAQPGATAAVATLRGTTKISLHINGQDLALEVEPRTTLLSALRTRLEPGLTGTKEVCDRGACGACSVQVDGALVASCMMLAVDAVGKKVTTIEGLSSGDRLDPIQQAFLKHDALQCGFCTPGMVMACKTLLEKNKNPKA